MGIGRISSNPLHFALTLAPMRLDAEPFTEHRLMRFHRWAMLWLNWFAAFLEAARGFAPLSRDAETIAHSWLDWIEQLIVNIVLIRAARRVRPLVWRRYRVPPSAQRSPTRRAILGSRLRRSLRARDLAGRIAALRQNIDAMTLRLARRLPRGLTRRHAACDAVTVDDAVLSACAPFSTPRAVDSS